MASFKGFPPKSERDPRIPAAFFTQLLPQIDSLPELSITLYAFWRLQQIEAAFPYLQLDDFTSDQLLMDSLAASKDEALTALLTALSAAADRGTLLQASIKIETKPLTLYFLNDRKGQDALQAVNSGKWQPPAVPNAPITLDLDRPNIFHLYEQNIGPLTPMIAETLQDAENEYPPEWIAKAIHEAIENNVRKWSYVEAILKNWQKEGKHARRDKKDSQEDRQKYVEGKYSDHIER